MEDGGIPVVVHFWPIAARWLLWTPGSGLACLLLLVWLSNTSQRTRHSMTTATQSNRSAQTNAPKTLAGVDISSWLSWTCYGVGFAVAMHLAPNMAADLSAGGLGLTVVAGAVALFFVLILLIQNQMRISLANTSFGEPRKLVNDGIFSVSRNPMYVAFLVPILSLAVFSPLAALGAAALYVMGMNELVIADEEAILTSMFGNDFRRYCAATPRWLVW